MLHLDQLLLTASLEKGRVMSAPQMQLFCSGVNEIRICSRYKALENQTQRAEPGTYIPSLPPYPPLITLAHRGQH